MELVTFHVGKDGEDEKFMVHKGEPLTSPAFMSTADIKSLEHACHYSSVLKAAFEGPFIEGQTQTYRLEHVRPVVFRLFVQWLYKQDIVVFQEDGILEGDSTSDVATKAKLCEERDLNMVQLWLLADQWIIRRLQNDVMKRFYEILETQLHRLVSEDCKYCSTHWIQYVYADERTALDSPLRMLAMHFSMIVMVAHPTWISGHRDHFPHEMLLELMLFVAKSMKEGYDWKTAIENLDLETNDSA